jgi:hypothetical protein
LTENQPIKTGHACHQRRKFIVDHRQKTIGNHTDQNAQVARDQIGGIAPGGGILKKCPK